MEKYELDISAADFRSLRHSVEDWITLNAVRDADAVCYIRLLYVSMLQKALDARFPKALWGAISTTEALNDLDKLVLHATNQVMRCWGSLMLAKTQVIL